MSLTPPPRLLPGLHLTRRDADRLQLGLDPPHRVVLPDLPEVRRLVGDLVAGHDPDTSATEAAVALDDIRAAGLLTTDGPAAAAARVARRRLAVDASPDVADQVMALWSAAGGEPLARRRTPDLAVVVADGEVARERLDRWVRDEVPHLLVRQHATRAAVGPFVVPGATACVRCVDCHLADLDPRRPLVLAQVTARDPMTPPEPDPTVRALALALAVRDLAAFAHGRQPVTWSATVEVGVEPELEPRRWLRHPACGCAWDVLASAVG